MLVRNSRRSASRRVAHQLHSWWQTRKVVVFEFSDGFDFTLHCRDYARQRTTIAITTSTAASQNSVTGNENT